MTTLETIGLVTAIGAGITALATGLNFLNNSIRKPKLRYKIDDIKDLGHLCVNSGDEGNKDLGLILGKEFKIENVGSRPSKHITIHVRTNSRLMPDPEVGTNIKGRTIDLRPREVYVHVDQMRAKGGRLILRVYVLQNDLTVLGKSFLADYEVSDSLGRAKEVKRLRYINKDIAT